MMFCKRKKLENVNKKLAIELKKEFIKCDQENYLKKELFKVKRQAVLKYLEEFVKPLSNNHGFYSIENLDQLLEYDINTLISDKNYRFFKKKRMERDRARLNEIIENTEFEIKVICNNYDKDNEVIFITFFCKYNNNNINIINYVVNEEFLTKIINEDHNQKLFEIDDYIQYYIDLHGCREQDIFKIVEYVLNMIRQKNVFQALDLNNLQLIFFQNFKVNKENKLISGLKFLVKFINILRRTEKSFGYFLILASFLYLIYTINSVDQNLNKISLLLKAIVSIILSIIVTTYFNISSFKLRRNLNRLIKIILGIFLIGFYLLLIIRIGNETKGGFLVQYTLLNIMFIFIGILFKKSFILELKIMELHGKRIYYWVGYFFINLFFSFLILYGLNIVYNMSLIYNILIFILWFISISVSFILGYNINKKIDRVLKVNFVNVDLINLYSSRIYFTSIFFEFREAKIFRIDMNELFPESAKNCKVEVLNQFNTVFPSFVNKSSKYFYLAVKKRSIKRFNHKLKLILSYDVDGEKKYLKVIMYLNIHTVDNEVFIKNYQIDKIKKIKKIKVCDNTLQLHVTNLLSVIHNSYVYNCDFEDLNKEIQEEERDSCWLIHSDDYGSGKSVFDKNLCINNGYTPVTISPWEANYDEDFLFLLYSRVLRVANKKSYLSLKSTVILWVIITATCTKFLYDIFGTFFTSITYGIKSILDDYLIYIPKLKIVYGYGIVLKNNYRIDLFEMLWILIFTLFVSWLCSKYLYQIIIHFKSSSRVHQDYYIHHLIRMVKRNKLLLLIEDLDRLEYEQYKIIMRLCSCLKSYLSPETILIGILSCSYENILNKEKLIQENRNIKEEEKKSQASKNVDDLINKVSAKFIGKK